MNNRPANVPGNEGRQRLDTYRRNLLALDRGRGLAAGGAVLGLLSSVLPWYRVSAFGFSEAVNGWHGWGYLAILAFLGAGALVLAPVFGVALQPVLAGLPPRVTEPRLLLGAGALAVLTTLLFVLTVAPDLGGGGLIKGGAAIGAWIAVPCGGLIAVGGYLAQRHQA